MCVMMIKFEAARAKKHLAVWDSSTRVERQPPPQVQQAQGAHSQQGDALGLDIILFRMCQYSSSIIIIIIIITEREMFTSSILEQFLVALESP